ncbi:EexN family lipoprotein [Rosenbergiella epipactidis]|uniref:EexN family lipoprotein n=3 Tax=Rosenbergiella epipactidis TaxID=1544694 RepID=UPI001F4E0715|nr:EexN family lipoprotein [Rosenbergiella epipactidis]
MSDKEMTMVRCGKRVLVVVGVLALSGCDKAYTPADFMKDAALRNKILTQCTQQHDQQSKNCQNAQEAQKKVDFEKQTGKTDIK